jgi:hypothetical protein
MPDQPAHILLMQDRIQKLSLGPADLVIVRDPADMSTFLEMTQQGIGFSPYANPVLLIPGGLERASRQDLLEALSVIDQAISVIDQHAADLARARVTDEVSRIITDLNASVLKRIN